MRWVTREHVGPDRVACAWLIQRWLDPRATIHYLDEAALAPAVRAGALPFHLTVAEAGQWDERTAFRQLLTEYRLEAREPALVRVAALVRRAEPDVAAPSPAAARLAASLTWLHTTALSDAEIVAQLLPFLEAVYQRRRSGPRPR